VKEKGLISPPLTDNITGFGTYDYIDRRKYVGILINGKRNGYGILRFTNGDHYEGGFKDDHMNGMGTFFYADGGKYVGSWMDDMKNGQGVLSYPNGDRYSLKKKGVILNPFWVPF
jgi:hypothetical protein